MKTEIFLHGGASSRDSEKNEKFFLEIIESVPSQKIRILCVYFARPFYRWEESFYEDKEIFESLTAEKKLDIKMAELESFKEQVVSSDIVFINGGMRGCLKEELLKLGALEQIFQGKVVVGISAGANMMSKYYYSSVAGDVREGLGLLPIKLFIHYEDDSEEELKMLDKYKEKLEIYKIPEEEYVKFDI